MSSNNWSQIAVITTAALFGVRPADLDIMHISIIFASMVGALWSLRRYKQKTLIEKLLYFVRIALTAAILASASSKIVAGFLPSHIQSDGLMVIIAFFIGQIGDDWQKAYNWFISLFKRKVEKKVQEGVENENN